jgi:hypothetical protein
MRVVVKAWTLGGLAQSGVMMFFNIDDFQKSLGHCERRFISEAIHTSTRLFDITGLLRGKTARNDVIG